MVSKPVRHRRVVRTSALLIACASMSAARASAQAAPAPDRTPVADLAPVWVGAGAATLGLGIGLFMIPAQAPADPSVGVWRGGLLFDEAVRDAARAPTLGGEQLARQLSDILLVATIAQAALTDSVVIPLLHDDPDLVWQASAAHALALGVMMSLGSVVKQATERARPFERDCASQPDLPGCGNGDSYRSFFSLHSGVAFTSAGFSCAMHLERTLYRDQGADIVSCGASIAAATATGFLRVVADVHYLTDVLVGAIGGFLIGYLVPLAVVPSRPRAPPLDDPGLPEGAEPLPTTPGLSWSAAPMLELGRDGGGTTLGASVSGSL